MKCLEEKIKQCFTMFVACHRPCRDRCLEAMDRVCMKMKDEKKRDRCLKNGKTACYKLPYDN